LSGRAGDESKAKTVKEATAQWLNTVSDAMPGKAAIAAALVASSPLYSGKVGGLYDGLAKIVGAPTNEALKHLHLAVSQLAVAAPQPSSPLGLPPVSNSPQSAIATTIGAADSKAALLQIHDWLRTQPPTKTCASLADDLHNHLSKSTPAK
jgi:hypothetical protein